MPELDLAATNEAEAIARVARGDHAALKDLYDSHAPRVLAIGLMLLKDRSEAEDVTQETFLDAWRRAPEFDRARGSVSAWICSIARSRAIDRLRSRGTAARAATAASREPAGPPPPPPLELAAARENREMLLAALQRLPPEQRTALELAYYEGLSQREIAERQQEPLGTIKTRVRLAMQRLGEFLAAAGALP